MSTASRRGLGLIALACGCLLPTAVVGYLAFYVNRAEYPSEIARGLSGWLGLTAELQQIGYPLPGTVEYRGLVLKQPQSGDEVARVERLRVSQSGTRLRAEGLTIHAFGAPAGSEGAAAAPTGGPVGEWLRRLRPPAEGSLDASLTDLNVHFAGRRYEFPGVRLRYFANAKGEPCVEAQLALAGRPLRQPAFLEIVLGGTGAVSEVRFETGEDAVPAGWLDAWLDCSRWLGPQATLRGQLGAQQFAGGWVLDFKGRADGVDLERLLPPHGRQGLSGRSTWDVGQLRWEGGSLHSLRATLTAGPGRVSTALLHALSGSAGFVLGPDVPPDALADYEQLAMHVSLQQGTLTVSGGCGSEEENIVFEAGDGRTLLRAPSTPHPVLAFARALGSHPVQLAGLRDDPVTRILVAPPQGRSRLGEPRGAKAPKSARREPPRLDP